MQRRQQSKEHLNAVLPVQLLLCAAILGALAACRWFCPPLFLAARQMYEDCFCEETEAAELVRFANVQLNALPLLSAAAEEADTASIAADSEKSGWSTFWGRVTATPAPTPRPAPEGSSLAPCPAEIALTFPLDTGIWSLSSGYGWRQHPLRGEEAFHEGVDLACGEGTVILAAQTGIVATAARSDSYGNWLSVRSADGLETRYAHLQYLFVRQGELVCAGQRLGTAGQTGDATGPHLHFELLQGDIRYDPSSALGLSS